MLVGQKQSFTKATCKYECLQICLLSRGTVIAEGAAGSLNWPTFSALSDQFRLHMSLCELNFSQPQLQEPKPARLDKPIVERAVSTSYSTCHQCQRLNWDHCRIKLRLLTQSRKRSCYVLTGMARQRLLHHSCLDAAGCFGAVLWVPQLFETRVAEALLQSCVKIAVENELLAGIWRMHRLDPRGGDATM